MQNIAGKKIHAHTTQIIVHSLRFHLKTEQAIRRRQLIDFIYNLTLWLLLSAMNEPVFAIHIFDAVPLSLIIK